MTRRTHTIERSFAGGYLSSDMYGRVDLDKYAVALAECTNVYVQPQGPMRKRTGFEFIREVHDSTEACRIIPFSFSDDQTYIVVLNGSCVEFITDAGVVVSAAKTIVSMTNANPCVFEITGHGMAVGDVFYVAGIDDFELYSYKVYSVPDANHIGVADMGGAAIDSTGYAVYAAGGSVYPVYCVAMTYTEAELFDLGYAQSADVMTLTHNAHPVALLSRLGAASWSLANASFAPQISAPTGITATNTGTGSKTYTYTVTAVDADGLEESLAGTDDSCTNDLETAGNYNTITWSAVTGALRYNVYKDYNGLFGFIGATEDLTFKDDNIIADVSLTPPTANDPFDATDKYPSTVCYFEQRKCFGNTNERPNTIWMTRSATEHNMTSSIPTQDDDAIQMRIAARELNEVRHLVPMSDLIMLTSSSEWMITTSDNGPLTPSNIKPREQAHNGANNVHPVLAANAALYVFASGMRVGSISQSTDSLNGGYTSEDVSILANDLFFGHQIVDMAYSSAPVQTLWAVRDDGVLLGMTYYPEHKVYAWHVHETDGLVESVACIREANEDILYAVINRTIDGRDRRYVERMSSRLEQTLENSFFVDSGLTYSGAAISTLTGLWHIEGETVNVLADGAVASKTVTNGTISLDTAASVITVGLPFTARAKTMPILIQDLPAHGLGLKKKIDTLYVRLVNSGHVSAGVNDGDLIEQPARTTEPYGTPPALKTGAYQLPVHSDWLTDIQPVVESSDPLPMNIVSLVTVVSVSEG